MGRRRIIISCEHAGNEIPAQFDFLFKGKENILKSHLGWDPGALPIAESLAEDLKVKLHSQPYSRLLIESNRSLDSPQLFSKYTLGLNDLIKQHLIRKYYLSYRNKVERSIANMIKQGDSVLHLSIHSFTPSLNGMERTADIGLLYDPSRKSEESFCFDLKKELENADKGLIIEYNYPYLGTDDGFPTHLRKRWTDEFYLGIEVEVNQELARWPKRKKIQLILNKCIRKVYFELDKMV